MPRTNWIPPLLILAAGAAGYALAQEPEATELTAAERQELAMKAMSLGRPGPEHELFRSMTGGWETEVKMWMSPGGPPRVVRGASQSELVLGGRFLRISSITAFMGTDVESILYLGFDRRHGQYTILGLDTMGTYWVTAMGPRDPETGTITLRGRDFDPVFGFEQVYDYVLEFPDADTRVMSIVFHDEFNAPDGPAKKLEITSRRKEE